MPGTYRSGRRAIPTAIHVLRGTLRSRNGRPRAPQPDPGRPVCPAEITGDPAARAHWDRLAAQLEQTHVLTPAHGDALGLLAQARADYDRVRAQLQGMHFQQLIVDEVYDKAGTLIRRRERENPLLRRSERLAQLVSRLLGEFGLTPITQTKVHGAAPDANAPARTHRYITRLR